MNKFKTALIAFWKDEDGLTTVEYAVAGALVAAAVIVAFQNLGTEVGETIGFITDDLAEANQARSTTN